jgi:hypothetical protein
MVIPAAGLEARVQTVPDGGLAVRSGGAGLRLSKRLAGSG